MSLLADLRKVDYTGDKLKYSQELTKLCKGVAPLTYPIHTITRHPINYVTKYPTFSFKDGAREYLVQLFLLNSDDVPVMPLEQKYLACGSCKGYSGGCSIYSPYFTDLAKGRQLLVISLTLDNSYIINAVTHQFTKRFNVLTGILQADKCSESEMKMLLSKLSKDLGFFLYLGNCGQCGKICSVLTERKCAKPTERTFSMESVGIDLELLHFKLYNTYLNWYYNGSGMFPQYYTRYGGVLLNNSREDIFDIYASLKFKLKEHLTNPLEYLKFLDKLDPIEYKPLVGYHKGSTERAYRIK